MKIFISWSGQKSHKIALLLRSWIPSVLYYAKPYVSSEDIGKGNKWNHSLDEELETSKFGIVCLTKLNVNSPWLHYEAGVLRRSVLKNGLSPLYIDTSPSNGPFEQFQGTACTKEDLLKLLMTINSFYKENPKINLDVLKKKVEESWAYFIEEFEYINNEDEFLYSKISADRLSPVCFRLVDDGVEFLLVRSSLNERWNHPKGIYFPERPFKNEVARIIQGEAGVTSFKVISHHFDRSFHYHGETKELHLLSLSLCQIFESTSPRDKLFGINRQPTFMSLSDTRKALREGRDDIFAMEAIRVLDKAYDEIILSVKIEV